MGSKAIIPIVAVGIAVTALILITRQARAAVPEIPAAEAPTIEDIMDAKSVAELNAYYDLAGELYIIGKISHEEYMALYDAYYERWYELVGAIE